MSFYYTHIHLESLAVHMHKVRHLHLYIGTKKNGMGFRGIESVAALKPKT